VPVEGRAWGPIQGSGDVKKLKAKNWYKWLDALGFAQSAVEQYWLKVNYFSWQSLADCEATAGFRKGDWIQLRILTRDPSFRSAPGGQPKSTWVVQFHVGDRVKDVRATLDIEATDGGKDG
jgi:hypothetical protein